MKKLLDDAAIRSYRDAGFHTPLRVFPASEAEDIRDALEAVEAKHGPVFTENRSHAGAAFQGSYRYKSHLLFKWLADVIRHPRILDAVEDLIGPDILCWTTHWFVKEARSPQYVSWHQDSNYWGVETCDLVSVWLAVSSSTVESGCVRLLPGSHKGPPMAHVDTWEEHNMLTRGQTIEGIDEAQAVNLELAPGEVALFDYRLAHASHPNLSGDRRIGIGMRYIPPSAYQVRHEWDSATLVRGKDRYGHFELEPAPTRDFDPVAVEMYRKTDEAQRAVYYRGAHRVDMTGPGIWSDRWSG